MKNNTEKAGGSGIVKATRKNEHNAGTAQTGRRTPRHWRSWPRRVCAGGLLTALAAGIFAGMPVHPASVSAAREAGAPRSRGVLRYEEAVADAADLQEIHAYITEKKNAAAGTLLQLGTKFWQGPEGIVCDRNPDSGPGDADVTQLGWPMILQAVTDSQKVPEGLKVLNPEAALHIEGVGESTDCYVTAVADNISRGKAAWADGQLLLGNGADNDRAVATVAGAKCRIFSIPYLEWGKRWRRSGMYTQALRRRRRDGPGVIRTASMCTGRSSSAGQNCIRRMLTGGRIRTSRREVPGTAADIHVGITADSLSHREHADMRILSKPLHGATILYADWTVRFMRTFGSAGRIQSIRMRRSDWRRFWKRAANSAGFPGRVKTGWCGQTPAAVCWAQARN